MHGILYSKDVLRLLAGEKPLILSRLLHPAYFVPETKMISNLMPELLRRRLHMAMIVNEYGSVEGLITIEDLIEELVGEIHDEYEPLEAGVERSQGWLLCSSRPTSPSTTCRPAIGLPFPESSDFETLAGFMLSRLQRIPHGGESVQYRGLEVHDCECRWEEDHQGKAEMAPSDPRGRFGEDRPCRCVARGGHLAPSRRL